MLEDTIEKGFEHVWQAILKTSQQLEKTDQEIKDLARQQKETDKKVEGYFAATARQLEETDKKVEGYFAATARQLEETDKKIEGYFAATSKQLEETDKQVKGYFAATARQFKETDKKLEKYFGKVKELDQNWGKLVEVLVQPSAAKQFQNRGIAVTGSDERKIKHLGGENIEIDILLTNGDDIIAIEVKTTLSVEDVNEHIEKHLKPFKRFFPEHKDKRLYGAVAYIHVNEKADRYAYKKGLFVLGFTADNLVTIKNDAKFKPVTWG